MSVVAAPLREPRNDSLLSTAPPSSSSFNHPPPFHHSISSPVVVPFPIYNQQPRIRSYHNMSHTQSFSALGPKKEIQQETSPTGPPPAPRPSVKTLPPASPDTSVIVPSQLPPTPDPSPPNSKVLFPDTVVSLIQDDPPTSAETPRRLPASDSTSALPITRSRAMTQNVIPIRPPNEHRPKSMGPPRPARKSQTVYPSSIRMSETHSADGRQRLSTFGTPTYVDSPGFPRTMTAPPDTTLGSGDATPSELNNTDGLEAKVVLLGSQGVGKTSLILRYTKGAFNTAPATIGSSLHTRKLVHSGVRVKLQIWDTAGQERFRSMAPIYYRGAHVCILVYDISDSRSFEDVRSWLEELQKTVPKETVIYIVGSKIDLRAREVRIEEARRTIRTWLSPQPSEIISPPDRGLFRSASLAVRESPPPSVVTTPTRSHSHSALATLSPDPSLPLSRTQSNVRTSPVLVDSPKPRSSMPFPSSRPLAPPALHIIPPLSSILPIPPRTTKISFGNLQSPTRPTSMTFTVPVTPLITPASPSHGISGGRFSISGVLGYSRANSTSGAISNLARLAEDYPASPRGDGSTSPVHSPAPRRVRIESTPHMALLDKRRKSEDWTSRSGRPWRMGEGPGAAEALGEFGAGVRRRQSGGDLLENDNRPISPSMSSSNFGLKTGGRSRGGSVGRDNRLYGDAEPAEEASWGTDVEGIRMGEVSALSGQGIDALFKSISALLVEKREKIERDRTLRRKDSVMLGDMKTDTPAGKSKRGGCCV